LRYLRSSTNLKLYFGSSEPVLIAYIDADMAGDVTAGSLFQGI